MKDVQLGLDLVVLHVQGTHLTQILERHVDVAHANPLALVVSLAPIVLAPVLFSVLVWGRRGLFHVYKRKTSLF